jgi:hypothetical protein
MANYNLISVESVIEDWLDFSGEDINELDETVLKKWADDCVERFMPGEQLNQRIALLHVHDYKAELPEGFQYATSVSYRDTEENVNMSNVHRSIVDTTISLLGTEAHVEPLCSCKTDHCTCHTPIIEVNIDNVKDVANQNLYLNYMSHFTKRGVSSGTTKPTTSVYHEDFKIMRRTSNDMYNIPYHVNECININADCEVEYDITRSNSGKLMLTSNKKECIVLISYLSIPLCSNGYRMIADLPIAFRTVNLFIEERLAYIQYRKSKEQKDRIFHDSIVPRVEQLIGRVRSQLSQPSPDEWKQWVRNTWTKLVPGYDSQKQFGRRTNDRYRYPDQTGGLFNHNI